MILPATGWTRGEIHVADQPRAAFRRRIAHAVDAHVNHRRAGLDHVRLHKFGDAHRGNQNVRAPAMRRDVARGGMANRHRRVRVFALLAKHRGHRFADDVAAAQNHHLRAVGFHVRAHEQFANARRRAGPKARRIAEHQLADVDRMKTVHVLLRRHGGINHRFADLLRQRRLHQNSVQRADRRSIFPAARAIQPRVVVSGRTCVSEKMPSSAQAFSLRPT